MHFSDDDLSATKRINVVGTTGSGKSTFSKRLSEILKIPYIEIDSVYWGPNWYEPPDKDFFPKLETALAGDKWILDGNYTRTTSIKWKEVQLIIWLDYPFSTVFYRAVKRAITRAWSKQELWKGTGNKESFRRSFFSSDSILLWTIKTYHDNRRKYNGNMMEDKYAHIKFVKLTNPEEAAQFLERIEKAVS